VCNRYDRAEPLDTGPWRSDVACRRSAFSWVLSCTDKTLAAVLFAALAIANTLLIYFPPAKSTAVHWWTSLLPPVAVLLVLVAMVVDFVVRRSIYAAGDVTQAKTCGSFWL